jgi:DNA-binding NarL/FixJ family response regulator
LAEGAALVDSRSDLSGCRILIAEDDALTANYIVAVLEKAGIGVAGTAATGGVALAIAMKTEVHLALVDIKLLGPMDGISLACELREQYGIRTVFLTGNTDPVVHRDAIRARPLGFLLKPFRPSQLFNQLQAIPASLLRPSIRPSEPGR